MTPDELTQSATRRASLQPHSGAARRFSDLKTNMRTLAADVDLLAFQSGVRREVFKKHGMLFGHFGHC